MGLRFKGLFMFQGIHKRILALLLIAYAPFCSAQEYPYFDFHTSAGIGYNTVYGSLKNYKLAGLPTAKFGLQYMYNRQNLYFGSGAELSLLMFQTKGVDLYDEVDYKDSQNEDLTMRYTFSDLHQRYTSLCIHIPLTAGYKYDDYYVQGSLAYSLHLAGLTTTIIDPLTTKGYYPNYIGDLSNMPDHYYTEKGYSYTHSNTFSSQFLLQLEAGMDITRQFPYGSVGNVLKRVIHQREGNTVNNRLRIGIWCDIGLGNLYKPFGRDITGSPQGDYSFIHYNINPHELQFKSVVNTPDISTQLSTFSIGVKATWVIRHRDLYRFR